LILQRSACSPERPSLGTALVAIRDLHEVGSASVTLPA
jgi:hypothetical protein